MLDGPRRAWFAPAAAAVVLLALALQLRAIPATFASQRVYFPDPDDYARCFRAALILDGRARVIRHMPQINAPAGMSPHWTAPTDWAIVAPAWLLGGWIRHPDPLGCVAACVPVALGVVYLAAFMILLRRGFGDAIGLIGGLLVALSPGFHRAFALGHCDHHALLELLLWIGVGCWIPRRAAAAPSTRAACLSGLAIGAAIWVASEALLTWACLAIGVLVATLLADDDARDRLLARRRTWGLAVVGVVGFAHLVENWPTPLLACSDRVSLLQVLLALAAVLAPVPNRAAPRASLRRLAVFGFVAIGLATWVLVDRNRMFEAVSRTEFLRWARHVFELQPLVTRAAGAWSARPMFDLLGFVPFVLPMLAFAVWRVQSIPRVVAWVLPPLALFVCALTVLQRRWIDHESLAPLPVALLGVAVIAERACRRLGTDASPGRVRRITPVATGLVMLLLCGPPIATVLRDTPARQAAARAYQQRTAYAADCIVRRERERADAESAASPGAILCEDGEGSMLLYRTGLPVVAAPYHRAIDGIVAAAAFFAERDERRAGEMLERLGVRYVVTPARAHEQLLNFEVVLFGEPRSFDPPQERIESDGSVRRKLRYRSGYERTMAYRLVVQTARPPAGLSLLASARERPEPNAPLSGLLYERAAVNPRSRSSEPTPGG